ncbi:hypothetical protein [uncultured Zhongshania sp.]|uniref:lipoate--protein ligase family protein n=1 Tax=uncultured Zhongshania sp. TaxID=1642288 RepID=UPI0025D1EC3A|nr:hypothetical protein [uncultured Zhongshania sp.]
MNDLSWDVDYAILPVPAELGLARDEEYFAACAKNATAVMRVWRCEQALIATPKEQRGANFSAACAQLAARDWPVHVRRSGGSCVPQGPGVLNFSMIYPAPVTEGIEESYDLLCKFLIGLFSQLGINAEVGDVPGSFCDGRFNLQVDGQKIVGTAQRRKPIKQTENVAVLAHACILLDLDLDTATGGINQLYELIGDQGRFEVGACTTVRQLMGERYQGVEEIGDLLRSYFLKSFNTSLGEQP